MPLLRNADKSKISKRKNPTSLLWYKENGYLPEALVNFLALMGYSSPDGEEVFSLARMLAEFDTRRMKTSSPIFDLEKLGWLNGEHLRALSEEELAEHLLAHLAYRRERGIEPNPETDGPLYAWIDAHGGLESAEVKAFLLETMPLVQTRIKTLEEYAPLTRCFFREDVTGYDPEMLVPKKRTMSDVKALLGTVVERLDGLDEWTTGSVEAALRALVDETGWKPRELFQPVRVAVTGSRISPPLFESMALIGRDESLQRLRQATA